MVVLVFGTIAGSSCVLDRQGGLEAGAGGEPAAGGAGQGGGVTSIGGAMTTCTAQADCGADTACANVDCVNGSCQTTFEDAGTACTQSSNDGGVCDGMGSCVECATEDDCSQGQCMDGLETGSQVCVQGSCMPVVGSVPCGNYTCNEAMTACLDSCADSSDCVDNHYCTAGSICVPIAMPGEACSAPDGCVTGSFCVDGFCCDGPCTDPCTGCSNALTGAADGICASVELGTSDPDTPCAAGYGCAGDGTCLACGDPTIVETSDCDAVCNGGCGGDKCNIDCTAQSPCTTVVCPAGRDCKVDCNGSGSCSMAAIQCPAGRGCEVICSNQAGSCSGATIQCGMGGPCKIDCKNGTGVCDGATVSCSDNLCDVKCSASMEPVIQNSAASCMPMTDAECP